MDKLIRNSTAEFLIFTSQSGANSIEVKVFDESVWLTQTMIAKLFDGYCGLQFVRKKINSDDDSQAF